MNFFPSTGYTLVERGMITLVHIPIWKWENWGHSNDEILLEKHGEGSSRGGEKQKRKFLDENLFLSLERIFFIHCTPWLQAVPSEISFLFHFSLQPSLKCSLGNMVSLGAAQFSQRPSFSWNPRNPRTFKSYMPMVFLVQTHDFFGSAVPSQTQQASDVFAANNISVFVITPKVLFWIEF